jgi:hypothetical protein
LPRSSAQSHRSYRILVIPENSGTQRHLPLPPDNALGPDGRREDDNQRCVRCCGALQHRCARRREMKSRRSTLIEDVNFHLRCLVAAHPPSPLSTHLSAASLGWVMATPSKRERLLCYDPQIRMGLRSLRPAPLWGPLAMERLKAWVGTIMDMKAATRTFRFRSDVFSWPQVDLMIKKRAFEGRRVRVTNGNRTCCARTLSLARKLGLGRGSGRG